MGFMLLLVFLYYIFSGATIARYYPPGRYELNDLEVFSRKNFESMTLKELEGDTVYDLLLLGSSHCYRDFDPRIFKTYGIKAYNFGTSSQTPLNTLPILRRVIHRTRGVLLEVYPITLNISGTESFVDLLTNTDDYVALTEMAWLLQDVRCMKLITVKPILDRYNNNQPVDRSHYESGYVETDQNAPPETVYERYDLDLREVEKQLRYVEAIIKLCQKNKVKIDLVYAPVPKELVIKKENHVKARIQNICRKYGIHFYNYGRNHNLPSRTCFFDDDHLNKTGVAKFNKILIRRLIKDGLNSR
ncbi:MAG TPA: hypothetical protein VHR47_06235 [Bacillota bacterium]|nr:hypothetical protein [Bacillota bacterium]